MRALLFALAAAACCLPAAAQDLSAKTDLPAKADYPSKPVMFVVPYAAGGGTETMARVLGRRLEQRLDKPFVIDNRPGRPAPSPPRSWRSQPRMATPS
jgi:tripartite-type tricarboxylate transporter receptor subunit TctC